LNFLSHYYFERFAVESHQVLGGLLPDLLKNVDKTYSIQIQKYEEHLGFHPQANAITVGWKRHVEVDKIFHNTDFFYEHTHRLRKELEPIVADLPIRASFLAHIALELLLDHILIEQNLVSVTRLYEHLENSNKGIVTNYLHVFETVDVDKFFKYYDRFVASKYIYDYGDINNIPYALLNICKRVWKFDFSEVHITNLIACLSAYKTNYLKDYMTIYDYISDKL